MTSSVDHVRGRAIAKVMLDRSPVLAGDRPRRRMVGWFEVGELVRLGRATYRSWRAGRRPPDEPAGPPPPVLTFGGGRAGDRDRPFWFDYVADLGDGFDPTMAVAWQLAQPGVTLAATGADRPALPTLPRGELLVFGGDQVYPHATEEAYRQQLVLPYRLAWDGVGVAPRDRPKVVAVPGNHDWMGGIGPFEDTFVHETSAEHWDAPQDRRWFAIGLPRRWWLWGIDLGLRQTLSDAQRDYFVRAAGRLDAGDRVILCTPVPLWHLRQRHPDRHDELRSFLDPLIAGRQSTMPLVLSGDSHLFAHHTRPAGWSGREEDHVTSGGGGAFLHPTHNLAEQIPSDGGPVEYELDARWPLASDSRALAPKLRQAIDRQFCSLVPLVALLHLAFAALVTVRLTVPGTPAAAEPGWADAAGWTIGAWPGWPVLLLMVLGGLLTTRPSSTEAVLARGARRWGLLHGGLQAAIVLVAAAFARWTLPGTRWWWHLAVVPMLAGLGALLTFELMTGLINRRTKANDNALFSKVHLTRYKHFLRLCIDAEGDLRVFAVGLDPVGAGWFDALAHRRPLPPFDPAGVPRLHDVWSKRIAGPSATTHRTAPTSRGPAATANG